MNWTEIILAIVAALLGGGNLFQWFQVRELKRKSSAEAYQTEISSLRMIIDEERQEIKRLETSYGELHSKYGDMQTRFFELEEELHKLKLSMLTSHNSRQYKQRKPKSTQLEKVSRKQQ